MCTQFFFKSSFNSHYDKKENIFLYQKRNNVYSSYFYCLHIILKKYIDISGKSGRVRVGYTRLVGYIGSGTGRVYPAGRVHRVGYGSGIPGLSGTSGISRVG